MLFVRSKTPAEVDMREVERLAKQPVIKFFQLVMKNTDT